MKQTIKYRDIKELICAQHAVLRDLLLQISDAIENQQDYKESLFRLISEFVALQRAERRTLGHACYRLNLLVSEMDELVEDTAIIRILIAELLQSIESSPPDSAQALSIVRLIEQLLSRKEAGFLNLIHGAFSDRQIFDMGIRFTEELLKKSSSVPI